MNDQAEVLTRSDMTKPGALERFHDSGRVGSVGIPIGSSRGGARFENMLQVMEFARMMALADVGVPAFLRGNPGACLRIAMQADEWGFSPFAVADKAYKVGDKIAYESQLIHALIERRAPLDGRLRMEHRGEGATRRCKVIGRLIGEDKPFEWEGPEFQQIKVKNSPEWAANPDKQLWYHASRDWARIYCPDVLMGIYTRDELEGTELGPSRARDVSDISGRLPASPQGGFDAQGIATTLREAGGNVADPEATKEPAPEKATSKPAKATVQRQDHDAETGEVIESSGTVIDQGGTVSENPIHVQTGGKVHEAGTPIEPTNRQEYVAYAEDWISRVTPEKSDDAEARWDGERELRAKCKVQVSERKKLEKALNARIAPGEGDDE